VLEPVGLGDQFEHLNQQAVVLFDDAVTRSDVSRNSLWAAGSVSTFAANSDRSLLPKGESLVANCRDQARILCDAGVDLFALEMLFDTEVTLAMYEALAGFDLPVILGFTCDHIDADGSEVVTARGMGCPEVPLDQVLRTVIDAVDSKNVIFSISQFTRIPGSLSIYACNSIAFAAPMNFSKRQPGGLKRVCR
jgi:hypothetical protein